MLYDDLVESLRPKVIDCCWTTLRVPFDRRFQFDRKPSTRKFSEVIGLPRFKAVKERAVRIFEVMDKKKTYLPTVEEIAGGIRMTYSCDTAIKNHVVFDVFPDKATVQIKSELSSPSRHDLIDTDAVFTALADHIIGDLVLVSEEDSCGK